MPGYTRESGNTLDVVAVCVNRIGMERRTRHPIANSRVAVQGDATCKARYQALRKAGHSHGRALRTVGDRLLETACAMMRSRSLYDPQCTAREPQAA